MKMRVAASVAGIALLVVTGCAPRMAADDRQALDESLRAAAVASESGLKAEEAALRAERAAAQVEDAAQRAERAAQRAEDAARRAEESARRADRAFELQQRK